jgi:hypothetical protein
MTGARGNELLWTTFFDIFDTLESFGSHLVKAVWPRTEIFFQHIKSGDYTPLEDFRIWLTVLFKRAGSHMNIKVRRYVQKHTLSRSYMTNQINEFLL